jgi:hypothetical protein
MMRVIKITPHIPYYLAEGNVVQSKWREPFVDRVGNKATLTKLEVLTKKGKIVDYTIQVQWE